MLKNVCNRLKIPCFSDSKEQHVDLKNTPIIPRAICQKKLLPKIQRPRFLEIGPRWGLDARDWDRRVKFKEMVFVDLPVLKPAINLWIGEITSPYKVFYANIMRLNNSLLSDLGHFDIIHASGVIYHIAEQLRFLKIIFDLLKSGGLAVIESWVSDSTENVVKIHWPQRSKKLFCHHEPSRGAIRAWLEMIGFSDVSVYDDIYPQKFRKHRTVLSAVKKAGAMTKSYLSLDDSSESATFGMDGNLEVLGITAKYIKVNFIP